MVYQSKKISKKNQKKSHKTNIHINRIYKISNRISFLISIFPSIIYLPKIHQLKKY